MRTIFHHVILLIVLAVLGCQHERTTSAANVNDVGAIVETRNRYAPPICGYNWRLFQPKVFAYDGIPITVKESEGRKEKGPWGWTGALAGITLFVFPWIETTHTHKTYTLSFVDKDIPDSVVDTCTKQGKAFTQIWSPFSLMFFNCEPELCFDNARTCSHVSYVGMSEAHEHIAVEDRAAAYGIACKLKELEDAGYINEDVKARQLMEQTMRGMALSQALAKGQSLLDAKDAPLPFRVVKLECDEGRDYLCRFELVKRDGGNLTISDGGKIRNAFMASVRAQYAAEHKDVNPRTLVVDFPEYAVSEGRIKGVAVVLTISPQSVAYDATTRKGRITVKIGANQFEDVRRWMRKNIEAIARDGNIAKDGDLLPSNARFYIGREKLAANGIFEMEFKTE